MTTLITMAQQAAASAAATVELPSSPPSDSFWMPKQASTSGAHVDWLFDFLMTVSVISAVAIFAAMVYFVVRYRARPREENEVPTDVPHHNTTLEITWSVIPLILVIAVFVWGFKGYVDLRTAPQSAMEIQVTGQKWKWFFTYPNGLTEPVLHVPKDRPVKLIIRSEDVLHSLYIPAFRVKMDAVPGRYTDLWFHATESGEFPIFCAEYCGTEHSGMLTKVVVHEGDGYRQWMEKRQQELQDKPPAELGAELYASQGCNACHTVDGSPKIGPSFKGLWGRDESFTDGTSAPVDENYIRQSILEPNAKIVKGYSPAMPTYQGKLSDQQLTGIIEYIKTLK